MVEDISVSLFFVLYLVCSLFVFCNALLSTHKRRNGLGGAEGIRTPDLRIANATLSQLSYGPSDGTVWHVTGRVSNAGLPPRCLLPGQESVNRV